VFISFLVLLPLAGLIKNFEMSKALSWQHLLRGLRQIPLGRPQAGCCVLLGEAKRWLTPLRADGNFIIANFIVRIPRGEVGYQSDTGIHPIYFRLNELEGGERGPIHFARGCQFFSGVARAELGAALPGAGSFFGG